VRWLLFARLGVALFILVFILISEGGWGEAIETRIVYGAVTGILALNAVYLLVLRRIGDADAFVRVQIGVDIATEAVLVFLTKGAASPIVVLFMLSILSAALVLSWRGAVAFAVEAAALHVVATVLYAVYALLSGAPSPEAREVLSRLLVQLPAFFAVALLAGLLAHRLSVARLLSHDILEVIGQGLIVADSGDRILFTNDEARRLLGAESCAPGRPLGEALPPEVRRELRLDPVTGRATAREVELEAPGGERIPASVAMRSMLDSGGRLVGTLAVLTDRTLERRVEEARLEARRSEAVSEMAAAIAHEIRNPLAAVRSSVQEIGQRALGRGEDDGWDEDSKALFDIVLSESDRLDAIVSDFLAFAKMRPTRKAPCDVSEVVAETSVVLRQSAEPGQRVEVECDCDGRLPARADAAQLRQVVLNLGLNSLDACLSAPAEAGRGREPPGAGRPARITLRAKACALLDFPLDSGANAEKARPSPGEKAGVEIDVIDEGSGMSPEVLGRAMDPFFTLKERGTGLGLAVVDRIVKAHGGLVKIESEEGRGTRVSLWIPAED
jgi:two-component system sensor histidine kinase PilS (NtrC family)